MQSFNILAGLEVTFCLSLHLHSCIQYKSREDSCKSVHLCRLKCADSLGLSLCGDAVSTNVGSTVLQRPCDCGVPWTIRASL